MAHLFISYASANRDRVTELANDLTSLDHTAWFDQELTGGQAWWDHILHRIRTCDAFVIVLTAETLESEACRRELAYALALGRTLLPVRIDRPVDMDHVPPEVLRWQIVDYGRGDKAGVLALNRALQRLQPSGALPDPLPQPPLVPISYVAEIIAEIRRKDELSYDEQAAIVFRLRDHLEQSRDVGGVTKAFETLLARRELYAKVRDEAHQVLAQAGAPLPPPPTTSGTRGNRAGGVDPRFGGQGPAGAANRSPARPITAGTSTPGADRGLGCGLGILSFVLPIGGLVLFVVNLVQQRNRAAGEAIVWAVCGMVMFCLCSGFMAALSEDMDPGYPYYPPVYQGF